MIALLRACHLQPTLAVTAITTALAIAAGRGFGATWVALAVLAGQLSVGWSNDHLDAERDRRAGRADKPVAVGAVPRRTVGAAAVAAALACVPLSLASGWRAAVVHLAAVAAAWAYNLGLKATPASPLPYAAAFAALPAFVTLGLDGHPWPSLWAPVAAALVGTGAHFVNALADLDDDVAHGVLGLPQRLGARASLLVGALLLAGAATVVALGPPGVPGPATAAALVAALAAVLAVAGTAVTGRQRAAWSFTLLVALLSVVLFLTQGDALAT